MRAILRALLPDIRGNAAVEFALVAPMLAASLVAMIDLGIGFYEKMEVENAAQAGAEYAVARGWSAASVANAVTASGTFAAISATPAPTQSCGCASGTTVAAAACGAVCPNGAAAGTYVTVNATAQYSTILSYPGLASPVTLSAQSIVRIQ